VRDDNGNRIPENPNRAALLEDWLWSTLHPDDAMVFGPEVTDVEVEQFKAIEPLVKAQAIPWSKSRQPRRQSTRSRPVRRPA
jgi:hypothetical protein